MLNRRILRIKAMQAHYARHLAIEASFLLAKDQITETFTPDLNREELQDKVLLKAQLKEATDALIAWRESDKKTTFTDDEVKEAFSTAKKFFLDKIKTETTSAKKNMLKEVENIHTSYLYFLKFINTLCVHGAEKTDSPNNFSSNTLLNRIAENQELKDSANLTDDDRAAIKKVYRETLSQEDYFNDYLDIATPTQDEEKQVVLEILKNLIFKNETLTELFGSKDLFWNENKAILKGMLKKTYKDFDESGIIHLTQNWEEDKEFFVNLFDGVVADEEEFNELIIASIKNWEIERLALTDKVIIMLGLSEMVQFANIPVKVSINEYIEISKTYSTPKSKQFINGLLDKLAEDMIADGKIKKWGRGLIDNK